MEMYTYPITVEREGRKYWAYSEDFPGVYGLGDSIEEAKASILESMQLYIEECRARRQVPLPFFLPQDVVDADAGRTSVSPLT
jgi:predicted RNase H-like HicB family nuclease